VRKSSNDIYAPAGGTIVAVNVELEDEVRRASSGSNAILNAHIHANLFPPFRMRPF
jgi:hypothetical protein